METIRLILVLVLISSATVLIVLSVVAFNKRKRLGPSAKCLASCLTAIAIYSFGYAMELSSSTVEGVFFWVRFEYLGIQSLAPTWFLFTLYQTGREKWITRGRVIAIFFIPVMIFLAAQTLGGLNLLHTNPGINWTGPFAIFDYTPTFLMIIGIIYMSSLLVASTVLFTTLIVWSTPALRSQSMIFWIGSFFPWVSGILYTFGVSPYDLDLTPLACVFTAILLSVGFFKFNLLTIIPLARDVIFDGMRDGVLVLDNQGLIIDFNKRLIEIFPAINRASIGKSAVKEFGAFEAVAELLENRQHTNIKISIELAGKTEHYQVMRSDLCNRSNKAVGEVITFYLYTEIKELLDQLEELATRDGLTGVNNRRHFFQMAEMELKRVERYGGRFSLVIFDLDHFKEINDKHGHLTGDVILKRVADTCQAALRKTDHMGRFGGEEFVFLLPATNLAEAQCMAERARRAIEGITFDELQLDSRITASFGIACTEGRKDIRLEELLRCADQALYQAKAAGRNKVCAVAPQKMGEGQSPD